METREEKESEEHTDTPEKTTVIKEKVLYRVKTMIEPEVAGTLCNTLEALVEVDVKTGRVTITKTQTGSRGNTRDFNFIDSRNGIVRAVGEMLIAAANLSQNIIRGDIR